MPRRSIDRLLAVHAASGVPGLERVLEETAPTRAWVDALLAAVGEPRAEVPALWMLRAYLQRGVELERGQTAALLRAVSRIEHDDARLLVCQSVAYLDVPRRNAQQLARFLRECATGAHRFTRAWAVDGLHRLALQHPEYRQEAAACLERAHRDPAASVRARARRIAREPGCGGSSPG